ACIGGRDYNSVDMSLQTLHDVYLPSFKAGIDAGAATVMSAFNDVNGVPCTGNKYLLRDVLRDQFGFKGFVVSDAMAISELEAHGYAEDDKDAAYKGFSAGVDMVMAGDLYNNNLPCLIEEGKITQEMVDESVLNILTIKYMLGLFEEPYVDPDGEKCFFAPEHRQAVKECAENAIVLLENNGVLPLKKDAKVALIGPVSEDSESVLGSWSCLYDEKQTVTVAEGLSKLLGDRLKVSYGCDFEDDSKEGFEEALKIANESDVIIAAVGETKNMSGEASSRASLELPGVQDELINALFDTGKPVVLLISAGRPLVLTGYKDRASAIVYMWQLGTETGSAVAEVLTGSFNPSGHLTTSFPERLGQIPVYYNHYNTGRPPIGRNRFEAKYIDAPVECLYPFGYGLSYTSFEYSDALLSQDVMAKDGELTVSVKVKNTGKCGGSDVMQLYVRDLFGSRVRPVKELKGYKKLYLEPHEEKTVTFTLKAKSLAFTREDMVNDAQPGDFKLWIAHDSKDDTIEFDFKVIE
ncbi:MAG: glycoside hydrolase family 3 C-terminal domain-containing protein, partial [Bacillota bacterium]|nr:glycoside hydrolase family 3 C-terminal domain-containing protein [Bacillota bacterium]